MPLTRLDGTLSTLQIDSRCLRDNRLGDPATRDVHVYLPPRGPASSRFPVLLVLPGFGSLSRALLPKDVFKESLVERFDRLIREGVCRPAVLVMPEACTRFGGSQFVDSPVTGRHQSFLAEEVFPAVDAAFPTLAEPAGRAILGTSSGGFGALRLAQDRPGTVSVVASIAGDALFELSLLPMLPKVAAKVLAFGGAGAFLAHIEEHGPSGDDYDPLFFIAAAQAYAPEPEQPSPHCALPFNPDTGELLEEVWSRFLASDPVTRMNASQGALRELQGVFLEAGLADEYGLQFAARRLYRGLSELAVPVSLHEFVGGHRGTGRRYEVVLPQVVDCLLGTPLQTQATSDALPREGSAQKPS